MSADKYHLVYCACAGVGTLLNPQRPSVSSYTKLYTATDIRVDAACNTSNTYSFLVECSLSDADLANVKNDPSIDYLLEMPPTLETKLFSFMTNGELQQIVTNMESRGYFATLQIGLTFRDLYRSLITESIIKRILSGAPLSNNLDFQINRRDIGKIKLRMIQAGIVLNDLIFQVGLTGRGLITEIKKERKKNDAMKRLFKTHMDVPHVYKPGVA